MVASTTMHEMAEAELRAVIADRIEALEEGVDTADQLMLMVNRDHARFLLRKLSAEAPDDV